MMEDNKNILLTNQNHISRLHFDTPTQVFFHHEGDDESYEDVGFAVDNLVICACCGGVVSLDEVDRLEYNPQVWCDMTAELKIDLREELDHFGATCGVVVDDED